MQYDALPGTGQPLRQAIQSLYHADEAHCIKALIKSLDLSEQHQDTTRKQAKKLVESIRLDRQAHGGLDAFFQEFALSSQEGIALMCLAEALLRVPDATTKDNLISDKLSDADWQAHIGKSESLFVNASTWGLLMTGKLVHLNRATDTDMRAYLGKATARSSAPVVRSAMTQAMKIIGRQFVLAETIQSALKESATKQKKGFTYSYDMLGEAAMSQKDADAYFRSYQTAITHIGRAANSKDPRNNPGISVKLSALHPRFEFAQGARLVNELLPNIKSLCVQAKSYHIGLTIDSEEADRLEPTLSILELLAMDPELAQWEGLGFALQSYQKRAPAVIDWLADLAHRSQHKLMVRLVKGAYWDTEIKLAQVNGYDDYPVYTRKVNTDIAYLSCAQKLIDQLDCFYPAFATHNAHTAASILSFAESRQLGSNQYEFQCLHGMGEMLYRQMVGEHGQRCRIYAPVGAHQQLLAYLVRRLLENGANSSFVNRLIDNTLPIEDIIQDPLARESQLQGHRNTSIPLPRELYGQTRSNSLGMDITDPNQLDAHIDSIQAAIPSYKNLSLLTAAVPQKPTTVITIKNPAQQDEAVGSIEFSSTQDVDKAIKKATQAHYDWDRLGGEKRASLLEAAADLFEKNRDELIQITMREAGKTLADGIAEVREAIDFLRYYAVAARRDFDQPQLLNGPTGESNEWSLHGRGVFVCISPWNFPLAIFAGQIGAALAAGNTVIAKPAEQTPLIAHRAVTLFHQAGVPTAVLQCLPGDGDIGAQLTKDPRIGGVAFTGSTLTAQRIQSALMARNTAIAPLIAETGGLNTMIVDSTALPEQVIRDVIDSAFQSAGQRCSALRMLYLQDDVADEMITLLHGAMDELLTDNPARLNTDIGPIIDQPARDNLIAHVEAMRAQGKAIYESPPSPNATQGNFFHPIAIEIEGIHELKEEVFGPVLHIARYRASELNDVIDAINATGYGLTMGIHSRIDATCQQIRARAKVGNLYINRNTIGAVVGVQPFGGEGLSGTGPKAGGPHYLHRFAVERVASIDTTAAGGNASLMSLQELIV